MIQSGLAVIFDMDGVIVHSNPMHRKAWVDFNARFGIETTEFMLERMYGKRNDEIIRDYFGDHLTSEEIVARGAAKEELYRQMIGSELENHLVPGVRQLLADLDDAPIGLGTNAEPANVEFLLAQAGLREFFDVVVDGHQVELPRPHPEVYLTVASRLGVAPRNCIIFEDSYSGVAAARRSGARVVGIRTTHREFSDVDFAADDFCSEELRVWLKSQEFRD